MRRGLTGQVTSIVCDTHAMAEAKCLTTGHGVNEYDVLGGALHQKSGLCCNLLYCSLGECVHVNQDENFELYDFFNSEILGC